MAAWLRLTAYVVLPVICVMLLAGRRNPRRWVGECCLVCTPALGLILPWLIVFYHTYQTPIPTWIGTDPWLRNIYPVMDWAMSRPFYYYPARLAIVTPLMLPGIVLVCTRIRLLKDNLVLQGLIWIVVLLVIMTVMAMRTTGFQTCRLGPLFVGLYVFLVLAATACEKPSCGWIMACWSCFFAGLIHSLVFMFDLESPLAHSLFERWRWFVL
jgi:hypothetical protein